MYRLFFIAALVALTAPSRAASACSDASQQQLFPLGTAGGDLIALAVEQVRDSELHSRWTVKTSLVRITPSKVTVVSTDEPRRFADHTRHVEALTKTLRRTLRAATRLEGFRPIAMTAQLECEHRATCGLASLVAGETALDVVVGERSVRVPVGRLDALYDHPSNYEIAGVRQFRAAGGTWTIVDLRAGDSRCSSLVDEAAARACARPKMLRRPVVAIADSYAWRFVYHHGFDLAVALWQPTREQ